MATSMALWFTHRRRKPSAPEPESVIGPGSPFGSEPQGFFEQIAILHRSHRLAPAVISHALQPSLGFQSRDALGKFSELLLNQFRSHNDKIPARILRIKRDFGP